MKRRDAREAAFFLIFEKSFHDEPMQQLIDIAVESRALELDDYARRLVLLVEEHQQELDGEIEKYLSNWKIGRLSRVTLTILRLSFCELAHFADIPVRVIINEAVEIAKTYATEADASYINGVLGAYVKAVPPQKDEEAAPVQKDEQACVDI